MPTEELADFMTKLIREAVTLPTHELEYDDRMQRRKERRAAEGWESPQEILKRRLARRDVERAKQGWTPDQIARGSRYIHPRTRPSDGQPVGSKHFDYEEYETRKRDRLASDPEYAAKRMARVKARRERATEYWTQLAEQRQLDNANADIAGLGIKNRLLDIWHAITQSEQAERIDRIYLDQRARIANRKNLERCQGRPRGLGAAARRAGF